MPRSPMIQLRLPHGLLRFGGGLGEWRSFDFTSRRCHSAEPVLSEAEGLRMTGVRFENAAIHEPDGERRFPDKLGMTGALRGAAEVI